jgi:hypothetical protein
MDDENDEQDENASRSIRESLTAASNVTITTNALQE